jgi:signal transduction histidine kinase
MKPRTASRLPWSVGTFSIALMMGSLAMMYVDRHTGLSASASTERWNFSNVLNAVVNMAVPAIGIVLASRRPENSIGWLFLTAGFTLGFSALGLTYGLHALVANPGSLPAGRFFAWAGNWIGLIPLGVLAFLFLLFPTGHLRSGRWRPVAWYVGGAFALVCGTNLIFVTQAWNDPFEQTSPNNPLLGLLLFALPVLSALALSLAAVVVRFRGSVGDERLQLKWFATAASLLVATFIATSLSSSPTPPPALSVLQSLAFVFLWTAIALAVLKYRLYEIDVVISRAVVYGSLAVFITLVYIGLVVGVGSIVGNRRSPVLSAVAAAVIAVAFQPIRERSRRFANRLVYGKRATPYEVVSAFAERMASAFSIEEVLPRTARLLAEGTGAVRADVWLRVGAELKAEGSWPSVAQGGRVPYTGHASLDVPGASCVVAVQHQGELLGALSIHKAPGDAVTPTEEKLLADIASQAGLVLRNVRLIEELRASRQRLVAAQDEERRKIERNIHDGAQQQLVSLAVKQRLVAGLIDRDGEKAKALIEDIQRETSEALEDLRDLARGIYPPLLADQGLPAALVAQARKSTVTTVVESDGVLRYPQEIESAVYFCCLEALQNVAKYARASSAQVRLAESATGLLFEVSDDGVGFDASATGYGTGLHGMADRVDALGGSIEIRSGPGQGTTVSGRIPTKR